MRKNSKILIAVVVTLLGLGLVIFRLTTFAEMFRVRADWAMTDFNSAIYYPVVAFLNGENPYAAERFLQRYPVDASFPLYLPATLIIHLPFGLLSPLAASSAYFIFTLCLTFLLAFVSLIFNKLKVTATDVVLIGGLILLSRSGHWNLLVGQGTLQFVLATYLTLYFAKRAPIISGIGLAITMIKPTFGVPIVLIMLAQKHVRSVIYGGTIATVVNLPMVLILAHREHGLASFWGELIKNLNSWQQDPVANPAVSIIRVDLVAFISRVVGTPLDQVPQMIILLFVIGIAIWISGRMTSIDNERFWSLSTGIICLAVLFSVHHQAYDLLLLTLPFVGLLYYRFPHEFYSSYLYNVSVGLLLLLMINYASTHSIMGFIHPKSTLWLIFVSINSVALLALYLIWVGTGYMICRNRENVDTSPAIPRKSIV